MKKAAVILIILNLLFPTLLLKAQFPPAAGQEGTTAIHTDSSIFVAWASACEVVQGPVNILEPTGMAASFGGPPEAIGKAEGNSVNVVSLGDCGFAILQFEIPIADGEGWDFAVFENALNDTFLELAFVEVSSDGENYYMFPAISLTPGNEQVGTFGEINTEMINNMAGKYRQGYGTPFDLSELSGYPELNLQSVTHVRITDAIGCIQNQYAFFDSQGNVINDPWPTPFETGGFDLDGVGLINTASEGLNENTADISIYPNPFADALQIDISGENKAISLEIFDMNSVSIYKSEIRYRKQIQLGSYPAGLYFIQIKHQDNIFIKKILKIE
nr:T9SS type A sorting domain-containing protein [Bacteroidota bacterium]